MYPEFEFRVELSIDFVDEPVVVVYSCLTYTVYRYVGLKDAGVYVMSIVISYSPDFRYCRV